MSGVMWKKGKLSSDGGDSGSKKRKRSFGRTYGVISQSLLLLGIKGQVINLCWCFWQKFDFSRHEDAFISS
jgi:hypothetical protein